MGVGVSYERGIPEDPAPEHLNPDTGADLSEDLAEKPQTQPPNLESLNPKSESREQTYQKTQTPGGSDRTCHSSLSDPLLEKV